MKYISPGGWFSLEYPMGWHEFEDTEESFLFYNPDRWTGNFRISAYKDEAADYGPQCIAYELKENTSSTLVKVGLCLQRGNFSGRRRLVHHSYLGDRRGGSLFRMFFYRVQRRRQASGGRNHPVFADPQRRCKSPA